MPKTPEKKVKDKVVSILKEHGVYYFFAAMNGFGRSGVPDIVCCVNGKFFAIECKANGNTPTELQIREMQKIATAGGIAIVVDETKLDTLGAFINLIRGNAYDGGT